jgi:SAM-dependent methyltransferase
MDDPSITIVWDAFTGYQRTAAIRAAIELDVFTAVAKGSDTAAALAAQCGASERGLRSLCDRLVVDGFLAKAEGRYALTPTAAMFLDRRQPSYLGSAITFLTAPTLAQAFDRLTQAVRKGGTAIDASGTLAPEHPVWVEFARAMAPLATFTAEMLAQLLGPGPATGRRILDVAAGHGKYGITLLRHDPHARVVAQDWPNVLGVAQENAAAAGVADRFRTLPGDAFTVDFGTGYDLVLLTNFLHHFDPPTCETLLRKACGALAPGGRVAAVEFVPDEERVSPPEAAVFSLVMLASTPHGDAYTFAEFQRMFAAAGLGHTELHPLPPEHAVIGWS